MNLFGAIKDRHKLYHHKQFTFWIQARHTLGGLFVCFNTVQRNKAKKKFNGLTMKAFVSFCDFYFRRKIKNSKDDAKKNLCENKLCNVNSMEMNTRKTKY